MKWTTLVATFAAVLALSQSAQARDHHHRGVARHHAWRHIVGRSHFAVEPQDTSLNWGRFASAAPVAHSGGSGRRPAAWCGWEMRQLVGSDPGAEYNLARNWAHWGQAGPAGVGAVVVWRHHVGRIVGQQDGQWLIQSGNDGHAVRTRVRSIAGAIAIRWG